MSSINEAIEFILGNRSSEEFGVGLASGIGSITRSSSSEDRTIVRSKNVSQREFSYHGVKYDSTLPVELIIYNIDGTFINTYKERELKKWLLSGKEQWLQVNQSDHSDIMYYGIVSKCQMIEIGTYTGGMLVIFECNAQNAWSGIKSKTYSTVNGTLNFKLALVTDYDDEIIKPSLIITSNAIGNIIIVNNTRNETIIINNCIVGEQIILDGNTGKISTTNGILLDKWNKRFLKLQDGINDITMNGGFTMKISYRLPVRIGG